MLWKQYKDTQDGNYVTWEFGILMSHILPSIRCRCDNAFSCDS